jgi:DNA modification methylase
MMVGQITLYHGDWQEFLSENAILQKDVDLVFSDPPYTDSTVNMEKLRAICTGSIILFSSPENQFFKPDEMAYWIKTPSTKNYSKKLGRFVELILIERHGYTFNADLHWSNYTGVYDDRLLEKQDHPYEKPMALLERFISIYSNPGDTVFDPYAGSGKIGVACKRLGRKYIGCEKDDKFFDLLKKNLGE